MSFPRRRESRKNSKQYYVCVVPIRKNYTIYIGVTRLRQFRRIKKGNWKVLRKNIK